MSVAEIDASLVRRLIAAQFPHWAGLPVKPVIPGGWDNRTFRLGDDLSVRLPSAPGYVPQVAKEQRWLPYLAGRLPLPIPAPVGLGAPGPGYPFPFSICRWLPGSTALATPPDDLPGFAADLGAFLAALSRVAADGGPLAGDHSCHRGGDLAVYDAETRDAVTTLGPAVDGGRALAIWDAARATRWVGPPVWVHGDIAAGNLLLSGGRLSAVIDFGCSATGDPACDLALGWVWGPGPARGALFGAAGHDADTALRGRAWAVWKALITAAGADRGSPARSAALASLALILQD
jgi:aminoglycoside phosphotransferase (APT) family kinase protein